jgi:hypothetical protein
MTTRRASGRGSICPFVVSKPSTGAGKGDAMSARRGGIPGPESRTGLTRPVMSEAEFDRRQGGAGPLDGDASAAIAEHEPSPRGASVPTTGRGRGTRGRGVVKPRRVQRMFALEEDLDKKLWLYAIHVGKDRSEVVNDLLRPLVASMVLYDSRDRRSGRSADADPGPAPSTVD